MAEKKGKKMVPAKKAAKKLVVETPYTKSQVVSHLAEESGLKKKDVTNVLEALTTLMNAHLAGKRGPGEFAIAGLMKVKVIHKPATKARKGINPFTKEETIFKAKPARKTIKIRPLKKLKTMVE